MAIRRQRSENVPIDFAQMRSTIPSAITDVRPIEAHPGHSSSGRIILQPAMTAETISVARAVKRSRLINSVAPRNVRWMRSALGQILGGMIVLTVICIPESLSQRFPAKGQLIPSYLLLLPGVVLR